MNYIYHRAPEFDKQFIKLTKKNKALKDRFINKIDQILTNPEIGDPKSYGLKGVRGIHVDPFVIAYMIIGNCIVFLYVGHHDEAYGKTAEILQKDRIIELLDKITRLYDYL
jgi:mRNA-degrading endonuclease RelE of RelBE toxin-antitoxin system